MVAVPSLEQHEKLQDQADSMVEEIIRLSQRLEALEHLLQERTQPVPEQRAEPKQET